MAQAAYVIPINYGFGFRGDTDTIWGIFPPDNFSAKIYADVQTLLTQYNGKLNIILDNQTVIGNNPKQICNRVVLEPNNYLASDFMLSVRREPSDF